MATSKQAGYVCCSKEDDTQHSSLFKCMFPALIRCHEKVQACQWTGPLKDLDAHTCYYVDVECPKSCGENVQKRNVETCAQECPKRDNQCLNYEMTFCGAFQHLTDNQDYSHGCLGNCEATIEQDGPKNHGQVSSEQKVPCELSCTVCETTTLRISQEQQQTLETKFESLKQEFQEHVNVKIQELVPVKMKHDDSKELRDQQKFQGLQEAPQHELVQTVHVVVEKELRQQQLKCKGAFQDEMKTHSQELVQTVKTKLEAVEKEKQDFLKVLSEKQDEFRRQQKQETDIQHQKLEESLKAKDEQITDLKKKITDVENKHELDVQEIRKQQADQTKTRKKSRTYTLVNYKKCKREKKKQEYSLNFSKDPAYPDLTLWIYPNGTKEVTGFLSLTVSLPPDHKDQSDHPSNLTITIELLNQRGYQHYVKKMTKESVDFKRGFLEKDMSDIKFISVADLELDDKQTQYLKDDCLKFRISTKVHHS